jgi:hypothetical protein
VVRCIFFQKIKDVALSDVALTQRRALGREK